MSSEIVNVKTEPNATFLRRCVIESISVGDGDAAYWAAVQLAHKATLKLNRDVQRKRQAQYRTKGARLFRWHANEGDDGLPSRWAYPAGVPEELQRVVRDKTQQQLDELLRNALPPGDATGEYGCPFCQRLLPVRKFNRLAGVSCCTGCMRKASKRYKIARLVWYRREYYKRQKLYRRIGWVHSLKRDK